MPMIALPDGTQKNCDAGASISEFMAAQLPGLAKQVIAASVDEIPVDLSYTVLKDISLRLILADDAEALDIIRHSTAHLLAQAVKRLYPRAQVTIGPVIAQGFYYDFAVDTPFSEEDLVRIEKEMQQIVTQRFAIKRRTMTREAAIEFFKAQAEHYKVAIIEDIPEGEVLSLYEQGEFTDLCRGPHVPHTGFLKAFKLTTVAGAYWRGDANNEMLQRIYGTAFSNKKALKQHLNRLEEAQKRDHRKLAKHLDLFHMQEEAPGMVFWHAKGWQLWQSIESFIRTQYLAAGYDEIKTPLVVDRSLWEKSGHWDKFQDEMFLTETESRCYAIKPMSCPCHVQVFNQGVKSYRDLPVRFAEFGHCHRCEPSGTLHGLMRVRAMVQDDGHIFCQEQQLQQEAKAFIEQVFTVYRLFGFDDILIKISTRPEKRVGSDKVWDKAEQCLIDACKQAGIDWSLNPGEGAFYGPKIEFSLKDCLERVWQCGTLQVDFSTPERLNAVYVAEDGTKQTPVMLHRAILGSMERFIGILIEHYAGVFPPWLAPIQVVIATITDDQLPYAKNVLRELLQCGFRAVLDERNEKVGFKIREHTLQKIPYMLIIGEKEVTESSVSVRPYAQHPQGSVPLTDFCNRLKLAIEQKHSMAMSQDTERA